MDDGSGEYGSESLPVYKKKRACGRDIHLDSKKRECEDLTDKKHLAAQTDFKARLVFGIKERNTDVAR